MPYIKGKDRINIDATLEPIQDYILRKYAAGEKINAGELNYVLSSIIHGWVTASPKICYAVMNEAMGALECAKLEFYRTVMAPYEDEKRTKNGSVSLLDDA